MSDTRSLIHLGTVAGTHGIKGGLRVRTFSGEYETLSALKTLFLQKGNGVVERLDVSSVRGQGKNAVLALKDRSSIEQVVEFIGAGIFAERSQLPPLPDGEYYWCDLIGMAVLLEDGTSLGEITSIIQTGSNDVYVVEDGSREVLIPAIEDVVVDIDPEARVMRVSLLEGLLEQ